MRKLLKRLWNSPFVIMLRRGSDAGRQAAYVDATSRGLDSTFRDLCDRGDCDGLAAKVLTEVALAREQVLNGKRDAAQGRIARLEANLSSAVTRRWGL